MWFDPLWGWLEEHIFSLPHSIKGGERLFNPYGASDPRIDLPGAGAIRRENLRRSLESLPAPPACLLIGEAPGWRGCRITGVPFASEAQIMEDRLPFKGSRTTTLAQPVSEASATIFWDTLGPYYPHFFAWNCLPLHPSRNDEPRSNRSPARQELRRFLPELKAICSLLAPQQVLCVGRQAEWALCQAGIPAVPIRHPSHGGKSSFQAGVEQVFSSLAASKV